MPKTSQPYPEAPQHLSTRSQDIWRTIGPEKAPNPCRRLLLQSALEALDRADQARAAIAEQGLTTTTKTTVKGDQIYLHALKNGAPIWVPLYPEVKFALECVPLPAEAPTDCPYYFWTGAGLREGHVRMMDRTLLAVFRKSGVKNAVAHRFRHTLATEILVKGGTIEDAANILGDSPATIRKYYLKYSVAYRDRTVEIMRRVNGTTAAHAENQTGTPLFSTDTGVRTVGLEPTRPLQASGF